ncbi:hypothetical protein ACFLV5_03275 [Chloroflexota bacterium]
MALNELKHRIPGYIAFGLLITLTTFWTYWGAGEAYYEGWWGAWYNRIIYLIPAAVLLALTLVGIRWPGKGGWTIVIVGGVIFVGWLVMSEFTVMNILKAFLLGGLAALVGVLFLLEARRRQRLHSKGWKPPGKWSRRNLPYLLAVGLPLLVIIAGWEPTSINVDGRRQKSTRLPTHCRQPSMPNIDDCRQTLTRPLTNCRQG